MDEVISELYESYVMGGMIKGMNTIPCSICQETLTNKPESEKLNRIDNIHFHSSEGSMCSRKLFNLIIFGNKLSFSSANFLMDGHLHESSILESIKAGLSDQWKLQICKNGEEKIVEILGIQIVIHPDAFLINKDTGVIIGIECKAVKSKNFDKYKTGKVDDLWVGQVQFYMFGYDIERYYVVVKNRDTSEIAFPIKIDRDMDKIMGMVKNFKDITDRVNRYKEIKGSNPDNSFINTNDIQPDRKHLHPKNIECEFCVFKTGCWL